MADTPTFNWSFWAKDLGERAITTLVQSLIVFLPALLAGNHDSSLIKAIAAASLPALFNLILNAILSIKPELLIIKNFYLDVLVRTLKTFLVAVLGAASGVGFDLFDASKWKVILLAAIVAAAAVLKGIIADRFTKNTITPASLAPAA